MLCLLCGSKLRKSNKTKYCFECKATYFPLKINDTDKKCYICEKKAKYILRDQTYCCCNNKNSCVIKIQENKKRQQNIKIYNKFDNFNNILCNYGCGQIGRFISPNGKICCEDSFNKCISMKEKNRFGKIGRPISEQQKKLLSEKMKGKKRSLESRKKQSDSVKKIWKDVKSIYNKKEFLKERAKKLKLNGASFDVFKPQIEFCEEVKRDINDRRVLNVRCTYCGKWFKPEKLEVYNRVACLKNKDPNISSENRFYCSNECKTLCPIFKKINWPDGHSSRTEVFPEVRKVVFERDNWECQKCEKTTELECHHIDPVSQEPFFANDPDSCITLCKDCHKEIHIKIEGCKYNELKQKKSC